MMQKKVVWSPSGLAEAECPMLYERKRLDPNYKRKVSPPADRGSAIHGVYAEMGPLKIKGKPISKAMVDEWIQENLHKYPGAVQQIKAIQKQCYSFIKAKFPQILKYSKFEEKIAIKLAPDGKSATVCEHFDDPEATFRGIMDMITYDYCDVEKRIKRIIVYDYKSQARIDTDLTLQMMVYQYMLAVAFPEVDSIEVMLYFTQYDYWAQGHVLHMDDKETLQEFRDEISARVRYAESMTSFPAIPGSACTYCDWVGRCPATKVDADMVIPEKIEDLGTAHKLLRELSYAANRDGKIKKAITDFMDRNNLQVLDDGKVCYGYSGSEGIDWKVANSEFNREKIIKHLIGMKIDPTDHMSFNKEASKKLFYKKNKPLLEEMLKLFPVKVTTSFRKMKPKGAK